MFLAEHADAGVYAGLLVSCKAGRAWVLRTARTARLSLDCTHRQPELRGVRPALCARGGKPTTLAVKCEVNSGEKAERDLHIQRFVTCLAALPDQLAGYGCSITDLQMDTWHWQTGESVTTFLLSAAPHLPHLTTLHLNAGPVCLPSPSCFPALTRLTLWPSAEGPEPEVATLAAAVYRSAAAYMGQLAHLHYIRCLRWPEPWPALLTPATTAHQLTSLETDCTLTDQLVGLLLDHAPQLQRLRVGCIDWDTADTGAYRERQWAVQHLEVWQNVGLEELAALPQPAAGQMIINAGTMALDLHSQVSSWSDAHYDASDRQGRHSITLRNHVPPCLSTPCIILCT